MTAPVWGCPWHGLVRNGLIELPNGSTMPYPGNIGSGQRAGNTYLVASPSAPPLERTPDELAADAAAGRQWRRTATLAGESPDLHGVAIGGWVYIDPAGAAWRVTGLGVTALFTNSLSLTITLARFGVLGGGPESYSHTVTLSDIGQSTPEIDDAGDGFRVDRYAELFDVSATGALASIRIALYYRLRNSSTGTYDDRGTLADWCGIPAGWLRLSISGPGSAASVSLSVDKTREQTLGMRSHEMSGGGASFSTQASVGGMILARWADGKTLTLDASSSYAQTEELVEVGYENGFEAWYLYAQTFDATQVYSFKLDGVEALNMASVPVYLERTKKDYVDGSPSEVSGVFYGLSADVVIPSDPGVPTHMASLRRWGITLANAPGGNFSFGVATLSNRVISTFRHAYNAAAEGMQARTFGASITPSGAVDTAEVTLPGVTYSYPSFGPRQNLYASQCPVTAQVTRDTAPICWI